MRGVPGSILRRIAAGSSGTRAARQSVAASDARDQAADERMQVIVLVSVAMIEREARGMKCLELRGDLGGQLPASLALAANRAPIAAMSQRNDPSRSPRAAKRHSGGSTGRPSTSTRCSPTRKPGLRRARATASSAAGPLDHQARRGQNAGSVRGLHGLVDFDSGAEVVRRDDQTLHAAPSSAAAVIG